MDESRYPIGHYNPPEHIDDVALKNWITEIEELPGELTEITAGMTDAQLGQQYREGSWNIRQLVHHIADSHLNSYVRFKWTLTEDEPLIKTYDQDLWSNLRESVESPIGPSLRFINSLHEKWCYLLRSMNSAQWARTFVHPENEQTITLKWNLGLYSWHGRHHLAHIRLALDR